jgi:hypothetical protein
MLDALANTAAPTVAQTATLRKLARATTENAIGDSRR